MVLFDSCSIFQQSASFLLSFFLLLRNLQKGYSSQGSKSAPYQEAPFLRKISTLFSWQFSLKACPSEKEAADHEFMKDESLEREPVILKEESEKEADRVLVIRTQGGDASAFDDLIRKYHPRLYGLVYHMISHHEDTNDLLQDIFSKAYRSIHSFQGKSSFYTWIYRIAVNMTLNFIKKSRRRHFSSIDDADHPLENDPDFMAATAVKDPAHLANNQELQKKLSSALLQLSQDHRAVVTLFDIQGIPQAEIAKILKTTEGTVRSRLFYAHRQLQNHLQEFIVK